MKNFKLTAALAACAMFVQPVFAASTFSDISATQYAWCADQIEEMADAGYVNGYEDGTYRPDNEVTKLECISLFARAMGSNEELNADLVELAKTQYSSNLTACSLSWGEEELAYMLLKGALTTEDLTTYIKGDSKNKAMTRGEAAVIITKAMNGESEAKSSTSSTLTYKDKSSIPSSYLQYVQYVTDQGIMNGIDDAFQPNGTVTRAQIAVMLSRVIEKCDYSFKSMTISNIDVENDTVTLKDADETDTDDEGTEYDIEKNLYCTMEGTAVDVTELEDNLAVIAQFSGSKLVGLDAISSVPDETIEGSYSGQSVLGQYQQIKVQTSDTGVTRTLTCADDYSVTYMGSPATLKSLKSGDSVTVTLKGGKVTAIEAVEKTLTISGATVEELIIDSESGIGIKISSSDADYDGKTYRTSDAVKVTKNSKEAELSDIYEGDRVSLTIQYGVITKIEATSTVSTVSGTITSVTIAEQSSITVRNDSGKEVSYQVPADCDVTVNGSEGSLYDFRVGDSVTLTTSSSAVTKIVCSPSVVSTSNEVSGVVQVVNSSYGFISVLTSESSVPVSVYINKQTVKINDISGNTLTVSSLKTGDTVQCYGSTKNGAFSSTFIVVTARAD